VARTPAEWAALAAAWRPGAAAEIDFRSDRGCRAPTRHPGCAVGERASRSAREVRAEQAPARRVSAQASPRLASCFDSVRGRDHQKWPVTEPTSTGVAPLVGAVLRGLVGDRSCFCSRTHIQASFHAAQRSSCWRACRWRSSSAAARAPGAFFSGADLLLVRRLATCSGWRGGVVVPAETAELRRRAKTSRTRSPTWAGLGASIRRD
jgi:hypothetical protein